jgi:hypothetical protein
MMICEGNAAAREKMLAMLETLGPESFADA